MIFPVLHPPLVPFYTCLIMVVRPLRSSHIIAFLSYPLVVDLLRPVRPSRLRPQTTWPTICSFLFSFASGLLVHNVPLYRLPPSTCNIKYTLTFRIQLKGVFAGHTWYVCILSGDWFTHTTISWDKYKEFLRLACSIFLRLPRAAWWVINPRPGGRRFANDPEAISPHGLQVLMTRRRGG